MTASFHVTADEEELALQTAQALQKSVTAVLQKEPLYALCLSGGNTPRRLYARLAQPPFSKSLPWSRIHFFFGDERFVPPDHPDSNLAMAREALFSRVHLPPENIHPIRTNGFSKASDAAAAYVKDLREFFGGSLWPYFDLILLGLGEDGHTASLFPGSPALEEQRHWAVAAAPPPPFSHERITLTFPAINNAARVFFLASGAGKADILRRVRAAAETPALAESSGLPAARVAPTKGTVDWWVDKAASPEG